MAYATREKYRQAWADAYMQDPDVPLNVDIELASVCNLSCPFCFIPDPAFDSHIKTKAPDGKPRARMMPTTMALRIIDECASLGVPALKMNWRGESTLHPDYSDILEYARLKMSYAPGHWHNEGGLRCRCAPTPSFHEILVNTNANCPDAAVDGLMAATKVMVSIDSLVPATYAVMRRGGNLERSKEVIGELIRRKHPNLWVRRVLTRENREEPFAAMVFNEFGRDGVHVSEHFCFDRNASSAHEQPGCDHDDAAIKRTYCGYPSQRLVIASTGLVYPCCIDLHEEMPIGDLNKEGLETIWHGAQMRNLRWELRNNLFKSKACQTCQSWMSHDAPQRAFVQDVEVKA